MSTADQFQVIGVSASLLGALAGAVAAPKDSAARPVCILFVFILGFALFYVASRTENANAAPVRQEAAPTPSLPQTNPENAPSNGSYQPGGSQTKGGVESPREQTVTPSPALESWGYVFPNDSQLYSIEFSGFPSDIADDAIQAIFRNHMPAIRERGVPVSAIVFHATVDPNQQSERCASLGGISATIEAQVSSRIELSSELFKTGHGFACFGSDGRTAEIEAIGQAFASMKN